MKVKIYVDEADLAALDYSLRNELAHDINFSILRPMNYSSGILNVIEVYLSVEDYETLKALKN